MQARYAGEEEAVTDAPHFRQKHSVLPPLMMSAAPAHICVCMHTQHAYIYIHPPIDSVDKHLLFLVGMLNCDTVFNSLATTCHVPLAKSWSAERRGSVEL